jgi:hypothetical protein
MTASLIKLTTTGLVVIAFALVGSRQLLAEQVTTPLSNVSAVVKVASLDTSKALPVYCDWMKKSDEISRSADEKFGENADGAQFVKKKAWDNKRQEKLAMTLSKNLGLDYVAIQVLASDENWVQRCYASDAGLVSVDEVQARAATDDDSVDVLEALELTYINRLKHDPDEYFDPEKYSAVHCEPKVIDGFRFVGCNLKSFFSGSSSFGLYLVARVNGRPIVSTFDTAAKQKIANRRSLNSADKEFIVGHYIIYPVPDAFLKAKQEFKALELN